jgi:hypothetical protein
MAGEESSFSSWREEDFARWLRENHPKPPEGRFTEFTLHVRHAPDHVFKATMADNYETCINELANELAMYADGLPAGESWKIVVNPAKRRKKKRMTLYSPGRPER